MFSKLRISARNIFVQQKFLEDIFNSEICNFKLASSFVLVRFWNYLRDYSLNCTPLAPIDLFRLYILFSQYRSCDDTQEIWSFVLFIKKRIFMLACTLFNEEDKGSNLLSIITWSVLGKQNVQAKKVYYYYLKTMRLLSFRRKLNAS